jgi:hypothetical protein
MFEAGDQRTSEEEGLVPPLIITLKQAVELGGVRNL